METCERKVGGGGGRGNRERDIYTNKQTRKGGREEGRRDEKRERERERERAVNRGEEWKLDGSGVNVRQGIRTRHKYQDKCAAAW